MCYVVILEIPKILSNPMKNLVQLPEIIPRIPPSSIEPLIKSQDRRLLYVAKQKVKEKNPLFGLSSVPLMPLKHLLCKYYLK